jgi:hypothetical protein
MPSDEEVTPRAGSLQAMTGLTQHAFEALRPQFEHALVATLQHRTSAGHPRTSRRDSPYDHGPLPTAADQQLFMLTYGPPNPIHAGPGPLFGRSPAHAKKWLPRLQAVLTHALAQPALLPARPADECAGMLAANRTAGVLHPPLFGMMVRRDRSTAPPMLRTSRTTPAASRRATRSRPSA